MLVSYPATSISFQFQPGRPGALDLVKCRSQGRMQYRLSSVQSLSHVQLCDPRDCCTPGFPIHHQFPELAQTHVHRDGDAIQPSHPLSSPSPAAFNLSQHRVFSNESVLHIRWPECWSFSFSISPSNEYSGLISFRMN